MTASPPNLHYRTWYAEGTFTYAPATFVCLEFLVPPDDQTMLAFKRSQFIYGYFAGRACWYTVKSDESEALIKEILG